MKASDYIANFLRKQEIDCVFEVAGGMITHLLDSCYRLGNMNIISVHHEQAAAFAADAYGRITGKPGVAMATSGPGATNLLTGIASCYFDSSPALFITGQVNTHEQKKNRPIRQLGFQETDIITMAQPITKHCYQVTDAESIPSILSHAYETAISGRPGPVLIDLPMNLQSKVIHAPEPQWIQRKKCVSSDLTALLAQLAEAIQCAKRPLILAGRGINSAFASELFARFVALTHIPVVSSLMAIDVLPYDCEERIGMIGTYGNRWANLSIGEADLLIVMGSRLDIRQTGADVQGFQGDKVIFHIDCDEGEVNNRVHHCIPIIADLEEMLLQANECFSSKCFDKKYEWQNRLNDLKLQWPDTRELQNIQGINPNEFMHAFSRHAKGIKSFVADVGNHQMWAAQSLELGLGQTFMTSGGMGAMGFALPAAIGASLALQRQPVAVIVGDGAFQMNIQELQTIVRNKLPIKIVVMNNQSLGMIRQFQDSYFESRYQSTYWGYSAPDFVAVAEAYGIASRSVSRPDEVQCGLEWLLADEHAAVLEVKICHKTNVYPKIAFGRPITEMEPFATPLEMEGT